MDLTSDAFTTLELEISHQFSQISLSARLANRRKIYLSMHLGKTLLHFNRHFLVVTNLILVSLAIK